MEKQFENLPSRPSEMNFDERVRYVRESKENDPDAYKTYITEISQYVEDGGDLEVRQQFYPGWTIEDFRTLLERLKDEGLFDE